MWDRVSVKENAKALYRKHFKIFVIVGLIGFLLFEGTTTFSRNSGVKEFRKPRNNIEYREDGVFNTFVNHDDFYINPNDEYHLIRRPSPLEQFIGIITSIFTSGIFLLLVVVGFLLSIFVINPILIGEKKFYLDSLDEDLKPVNLLYYHKNGYTVPIGIKVALLNLYLMFFFLLFIIPGFIKAYQYYFVPYILTDDPDLSLSDAISISKSMTYGDKMNLFIFDISFILWRFLGSIILFGLGGSLVRPYIEISRASVYKIKRDHIAITDY